MTPVIVESPYAGNVGLNLSYLYAALRDCLLRGEAPWASHGLYTLPGVLDDRIPTERALGIEAGLVWGYFARRTVVYTDLGFSNGMRMGIERARRENRHVEERKLPGFNPRALSYPLDGRVSALLAEVNTLRIELSLARARHKRLGDFWGVLEHAERMKLYEQIFEGGKAA